jgi:hypothetical protein
MESKKLESKELRKYLNNIDDETWAYLGNFFSNFVTDEELERWIEYYCNTFNKQLRYEPEIFTSMITYFLESVFCNAEKYNKIPLILKEFIESREDELYILGNRLYEAISYYEERKRLLNCICDENILNRDQCKKCTLLKIVEDAVK